MDAELLSDTFVGLADTMVADFDVIDSPTSPATPSTAPPPTSRPSATGVRRGYKEVLIAAALQGAIRQGPASKIAHRDRCRRA